MQQKLSNASVPMRLNFLFYQFSVPKQVTVYLELLCDTVFVLLYNITDSCIYTHGL